MSQLVPSLAGDARYAFRSLARTPIFTVSVLVTLALGIAVCTAVFSLINSLLLRPLPFPDGERLVHVWSTDQRQGWDRQYTAALDYLDWRRESRSFRDLGAFYNREYNLAGAGEPERVQAARVTASVFPMLGIEPAIGRVIESDEERQGARVAILGHGLWQRRFAGDRGIVGRTVRVDGEPHEVVGVMPPEFVFPMPTTQIWLPAQLDTATADRALQSLQVVARLDPGASIEQAQAELSRVATTLAAAHPETNADRGTNVVPLRHALLFAYDQVRLVSTILAAAVIFVLFLVCANVANLLLVRYAGRVQEVAIRNAVGAGQARLLRQFLVESLVLAVLGGGLGLLLAGSLVRFLATSVPDNLYRSGRIGIDGDTALFAAGVAVATALLVGLLPSLQTLRPSLVPALREGGAAPGGRAARRRYNVLVVAQVAVAAVLLVSALLMIESVENLRRLDPGFEAHRVLAVKLTLPSGQYPDETSRVGFVAQAVEELAGQPGVVAAAAVNFLPLNNETRWRSVAVDGSDAETSSAIELVVTPEYFDVLGVPLRHGRAFAASDRLDAPAVVIVNRAFAERHWPGKDAIGRRLSFSDDGGGDWRTVVGVADDYHHEDLSGAVQPQIFVPFAQSPWPYLRILVRSAGDPWIPFATVRSTIGAIDPDLPTAEAHTLAEIVERSLTVQRMISASLTGLAAGALLLAAVGLYGVMAARVTNSSHEIGLRMALGAERRAILRQVLLQAAKLTSIGLALGLVAAAGLSAGLGRMLYGVEPLDPVVFAVVLLLLAAVALVAALLPARRASRISPMAALRHE